MRSRAIKQQSHLKFESAAYRNAFPDASIYAYWGVNDCRQLHEEIDITSSWPMPTSPQARRTAILMSEARANGIEARTMLDIYLAWGETIQKQLPKGTPSKYRDALRNAIKCSDLALLRTIEPIDIKRGEKLSELLGSDHAIDANAPAIATAFTLLTWSLPLGRKEDPRKTAESAWSDSVILLGALQGVTPRDELENVMGNAAAFARDLLFHRTP